MQLQLDALPCQLATLIPLGMSMAALALAIARRLKARSQP
jgi:hypothetical protein